MRGLKAFDRFAHEGVRTELERIKKCFAPDGRVLFGSSGERELTISAHDRSAYVRKYKRQTGWSVVLHADGRTGPREYFDDEDSVLDLLKRHFQ